MLGTDLESAGGWTPAQGLMKNEQLLAKTHKLQEKLSSHSLHVSEGFGLLSLARDQKLTHLCYLLGSCTSRKQRSSSASARFLICIVAEAAICESWRFRRSRMGTNANHLHAAIVNVVQTQRMNHKLIPHTLALTPEPLPHPFASNPFPKTCRKSHHQNKIAASSSGSGGGI